MKFIYAICIICFLATFVDSSRGETVRNVPSSSLGVINGTKVSITKFPYMASFRIKGNVGGSAVVLNERWLLTTAWNVYKSNISDLEFRVGSNKYSSGGQVLKIEKVIIHENFKPGTWDSDIALVKVRPMRFGRKVKPIALGTQDLKGGTKVVVSGWGERDQTGAPSEVLLAANVTVLDWKTCNETYKTSLTPRMMCSFDKNVGPCARDFGDPLVLNKAAYGLYCGGNHCIPGTNPVLYTEVSAFNDWINKTISNNDHVMKIETSI